MTKQIVAITNFYVVDTESETDAVVKACALEKANARHKLMRVEVNPENVELSEVE